MSAETIATLTRERDEALAIVDVLRGVGCNEDGDGPCGVCRECFYRHGYRRGAEAMREACAQECREQAHTESMLECVEYIRALPIPEEP